MREVPPRRPLGNVGAGVGVADGAQVGRGDAVAWTDAAQGCFGGGSVGRADQDCGQCGSGRTAPRMHQCWADRAPLRAGVVRVHAISRLAGCVVVIARVGTDTRRSARRWARVCRDSMSWAASVLERPGWQ